SNPTVSRSGREQRPRTRALCGPWFCKNRTTQRVLPHAGGRAGRRPCPLGCPAAFRVGECLFCRVESADKHREWDLSRIEKLCVEKGLRMTEQRRVIARVLSDATDHPDAEELYRRASVVDPHISIATVYRTVKLFEDAGI